MQSRLKLLAVALVGFSAAVLAWVSVDRNKHFEPQTSEGVLRIAYSSPELGIGFTYPAEWGLVNEWVMSSSTERAFLLAGDLAILSFTAANEEVAYRSDLFPASSTPKIVLATSDLNIQWGEVGEQYVYRGDAAPPPCPIDALQASCTWSVNPQLPSLAYYDAMRARSDIAYSFFKRVNLQSPRSRFTGINVIFELGPRYPITTAEYQNPMPFPDYINWAYTAARTNRVQAEKRLNLIGFDTLVESIHFVPPSGE